MIVAANQFFLVSEDDTFSYILGYTIPKACNLYLPYIDSGNLNFQQDFLVLKEGVPTNLYGYKTPYATTVNNIERVKNNRSFYLITNTIALTKGGERNYPDELPIYFATMLRYNNIDLVRGKHKEIIQEVVYKFNYTAHSLLALLMKLSFRPRLRFLQETLDWLYRFGACRIRNKLTTYGVINSAWRLVLHAIMLDLDVVPIVRFNALKTYFCFHPGSLKYLLAKTEELEPKLLDIRITERKHIFTRDILVYNSPYLGNNLILRDTL